MEERREAAGDRAIVMEVGREVGAVTQAAAILRAIAGARDALGVTAIARAAGVSPSTTLNILRTLVHEGFVALVPETKTYRLGLGLLEVARPLLNRSDVELLQPGLQPIATEFEATTTIWQVAPDDKALLLGRIVPASGIHIEFRLATRIPAYAGAIGRAVAAAGERAGQLPRATLRARFGAIRWHVPVAFDTFLAEVEAAAARGYAVDLGHLIRGVTSVAAALCDRTGRPRLVVAAHLFQGQLTEERLEALGLALRGLTARAQPAMFGVAEGVGPVQRGGRR
ncbi:IclR family transcriptional regulator [Methylobacterium currus]|uniref:IclR family transcriptional regulator n=1 Tax=Methylobacterium currus TaxID=2051553 RepID=A0A2R4WEM5_9HYPH|nr:helix-turn-helix domain-containing protein [Methylobacterium currus]AWB19972.1 IclR family transcriptional regulator [Methylobacterium currus]UHC15303.1 helix-turn-helix domain-containing protein [Methylobacterium currus]